MSVLLPVHVFEAQSIYQLPDASIRRKIKYSLLPFLHYLYMCCFDIPIVLHDGEGESNTTGPKRQLSQTEHGKSAEGNMNYNSSCEAYKEIAEETAKNIRAGTQRLLAESFRGKSVVLKQWDKQSNQGYCKKKKHVNLFMMCTAWQSRKDAYFNLCKIYS